jgi:uncharacterized protein (DUF697 family)
MLKKRNKLNITDDQKKKCNAIIHSHAAACGGVGTGMAQIPLADNAVITPIQIAMIIELGAVFKMDISKSVAQSIISGASASLIGRGVSQVLFGWMPGIGNAINTATAAGLTEAIGWLAVDRFSKEQYVSKKLSEEKSESGKAEERTEEETVHMHTTDEETTTEEKTDLYKELMEAADLYIYGEKILTEDNKSEYSALLDQIAIEMKSLPKDHILQEKWKKLNKVESGEIESRNS